MAFEVGAIISKLTLNTQKWSQSVSQVEQDQTKMQRSAKSTGDKMRKMGTAMTVAGTAITAALGLMTKKFVDTGDWIDKMSKRTGISAESLSELAYAADLSGASLNDVERSVKRMAGSILDAHAGLESYARAFRQMGLSVDDLMKMNPEQQFLAISEAIASIEDPTIRAALAQDVFGRAGTTLLPMMSEGAEGLRNLREEARELGIIYSEDTAAAAAKLKDVQTALKKSWEGLSLTFMETLAPMLTKLVEGITNIVVKIKDWMREHPGLAAGIAKVAAVGAPLMAMLGTMMLLLPKLAAGFGIMKGALVGMISPIGLLVAAVGALAVGWLKVKAAQDKANESARNALEVENKLFRKLKEAADAAGLSEQAFHKLRKEYDYNAASMAMAIKRGKEGKELQEALANTVGESEEAQKKYNESVALTIPTFQGYLDQVEKVKVETKTWLDYLKDVGVMTIQDKAKRVDELEGYLRDLDQAYKDGKLSLDDYLTATRKAKGEITDLSTTLVTTAIPAARDMSLVYSNAVATMEDRTDKAEKVVKEKTELIESHWKGVTERMRDMWSRELGEMLSGAKSFKDAAGAVWSEMKRMFFDMVAQMVTKWVFGFVQKMITSTLTSTTSVTSQLTSTAKNIIGAVGKWSPGGIVGSAIQGAVSGLFSGIFGGKGMSKATANHIKDLVDNSIRIRDILAIDFRDNQYNWMLGRFDTMIFGLHEIIPRKFDAVNKRLDVIKGHTKTIADRIRKMVSAQGGAVVTDTTLAVLHGTPSNPEIAAPMSMLRGAGGGASTLNKNVAVNIYVANQLDPHSAQRIVREQIVPQMLRAVEVDPRNRSELQRIMGIKK